MSKGSHDDSTGRRFLTSTATGVLKVVVDVGNSSTKVAGYSPDASSGIWQFRSVFDHSDQRLGELIGEQAHWTIASVNQSRLEQLTTWIETNRPLDQGTPAFAAGAGAELGHPADIECGISRSSRR